jgi:hypothetical protein
MTTRVAFVVACGVAILSVSCNGANGGAMPAPAAPSSSETFSGTTVSGTVSLPVIMSEAGVVQLTARVTPTPPPGTLNLGFGTPQGAQCATMATATNASGDATVALSQTISVPGRYCVALGWSGQTTAAYTLTLTTCVNGGATACSDVTVSR